MSFAKKLQQICLNEKEARIYESLLEAGEAPAQELAIRSGINRATTYIALDNLMSLGLVRRLNKKNKTIFRMESPQQIIDLLERKKEDVEVKIKLAKEMLPELEMFQKVTGEKAKVRFFEGKEGSKMIQKDIVRSSPKFTDEIFNINFALKQFPVSKNDHRQAIRQKKIQGRSIVIYNPREPIPNLPFFYKEERRYLPENKNPFNAEIVLYNNKAAILSAKGEYMGIIIENKAIVDGLRFLFNLAWQGADKYLPFKTKK
ncbi:MAG: hypothetical protein NTX00_03420 [Candidatus Parcubacteria bacterium]|nr:hypothetical protein [Candidatus Parcubacteria bacterium]